MSLSDQLYRGIRFIDIRIRHQWDHFSIYHGSCQQNATFGPDVLDVCIGFLDEHPTETIVMRIKEQDNQRDPENTFTERLLAYIDPWPEFIYQSDDYQVIPTLGELRGKIFILQDCDYGYSHSFCTPIVGPLWPNCVYCSIGNFYIQDDYDGYVCVVGNHFKTIGWKWVNRVRPFRNTTIAGAHDVIYINFISGYLHGDGPHGLAWGCGVTHSHGMNERYIWDLVEYMNYYQSNWCWTSQREGAVMMDFFDETSRNRPGIHEYGEYLVDLLIRQNPIIPYRNPDWMSQISNCRRISELSIPGTNQSLGRNLNGKDGYQSLPLETQLKSGIRALDVLCVHKKDRFQIYTYKEPERWEKQLAWFGATADSTGPGYRGLTNVLKECVKFLKEYPTETIIMRVRDGDLGDGNNREFWETFKWYISEDGCNLGPNDEFVRYGDYVWQSEDYSMVPFMREARGKIVFLQDFESPIQFGPLWNSVVGRNFPVCCEGDIQGKWDSTKVDLERTASGMPDRLYANFLSGAIEMMKPRDLANGISGIEGMNIRAYDFLKEELDQGNIQRYGIVMMDFPGPGLIEVVIGHNEVAQPREPVFVDIKPGSCINPLNATNYPKGNGVLPVAILGTEDFDVSDIDPETITLNCISPLRWSYEDVSTPAESNDSGCMCPEEDADGYEDMTLKFRRKEIISSLTGGSSGNTDNSTHSPIRENHNFVIEGQLYDGTLIGGTDCVTLKTNGEVPPDTDQGDSTSVSSNTADKITLYGNHPNPFNSATQINFYIPEAVHVKLEVHNVLGQRIATLVDKRMEAGEHFVNWDAGNVASGIYLFRMTAAGFTESRKMVLLK
jgi:1-phosphatidylinositol phosphodiesterase